MFSRAGSIAVAAGFVVLLARAPIAAQEMYEVPKRAHIKIFEPKNYAELKSPVKFRVEAVAMITKPAGELEPGTGHHHIIVNTQPPKKGDVIPVDEKHIHWDDGRSEGEIELKPGLYTITVQFGDGLHRSFGRKLARTILIRVKK